ncbi:MAG: hypothetical protein ACFCUU_18680 [Cyclobacteriaceae bacterium]
MELRVLLFTFSIFSLGCANEKETFNKCDYEDYSPHDFYTVKGIVYETNTYFSKKYLDTSRDIFYMYQIDSVTIFEDVIKESTLMGIKEGDFLDILVHKDDPRINFYNGRGIR